MDDGGISAAMTTALHMFVEHSRRTGRTDRMLQAAAEGDIIVVTHAAERRQLRRRLDQLGKRDVEVVVQDPERHPFERLVRNRRGATIFDHGWIEAYWIRELRRVGADLSVFEFALSKGGDWEADNIPTLDRPHWMCLDLAADEEPRSST